MAKLQKTLEAAIAEKPYQIIVEILADKAALNGLVMSQRERKKLLKHLKAEASGSFRIRRWRRPFSKVVLEVTEEDINRLDEQLSDSADIEVMFNSTVESASTTMFKRFEDAWSRELHRQTRQRRGFEKRLNKQWGTGIERLRMFLAVSTEFGNSVNSSLCPTSIVSSPPVASSRNVTIEVSSNTRLIQVLLRQRSLCLE
jgi:hypothetical protein